MSIRNEFFKQLDKNLSDRKKEIAEDHGTTEKKKKKKKKK